MKTIEKIILSTTEPTHKNVCWLKPTPGETYTLYIFGSNGWTPVSEETEITKILSESGTANGYMKTDGTIDTSSESATIYKYDIDAEATKVLITNSTQLPGASGLCTMWIVDINNTPLVKFSVDTTSNDLTDYSVIPPSNSSQIWVQSDSNKTPIVKAVCPMSVGDVMAILQEKSQAPDKVITLYMGDDTAKSAENIKKLDEYISYYGLTNQDAGIPCVINILEVSQSAGFIQYNVLSDGKSGLIRSFNHNSILVYDMDATGKITQRSNEWYIIGPALEAAYGYVKKAAKVTPLASSATLADVITQFNSLLTAMGNANLMTT